MLMRALSLAVAFVAFALPAAAADDGEKPGSYILLIDKDGRPVAGTYRLGPGVQLVTESSDGGLPREAIYVDRAFFPQREASFLSFFNNRHAYTPDPTAVQVGEEARIDDRQTKLPPLFKDQKTERERVFRLTVSALVASTLGDTKVVGKRYRREGYGPDDTDPWAGDRFYIETLDMDLSLAAAQRVAAMERGTALSSGDFLAQYTVRSTKIPAFAKCISDKRETADYKALAEAQRAGPDALMGTQFLSEGKVFWQDKALSEVQFKMSVFTLCPN